MTEEWRAVVGFEGLYEVSDLGRVRSFVRPGEPRVLRPGLASTGYYTVALGGTSWTIHSLVATAFLGPRPPGQQVRHKSGVRADSRLANIEYGTPAENAADKDRHGTKVRGSMYSSAKLTEATAREIRAAKGVVSQAELAQRYGVSSAAVQAVHDGRTWTHA